MKRGLRFAIVAVLVGAAVAIWHAAVPGDAPRAAADGGKPPPAADATLPAPSAAPQPIAASATEEADGDGLRRVPIPPVDTRTPAWLSLSQARESGDERAPPLQRDAGAERAAPGLLADHQAYAARELAQTRRLAAAYANAAGPELERLRADLERGRAAGVPPDELAKVEEKMRRIEEQRKAANATLPESKGP